MSGTSIAADDFGRSLWQHAQVHPHRSRPSFKLQHCEIRRRWRGSNVRGKERQDRGKYLTHLPSWRRDDLALQAYLDGYAPVAMEAMEGIQALVHDCTTRCTIEAWRSPARIRGRYSG